MTQLANKELARIQVKLNSQVGSECGKNPASTSIPISTGVKNDHLVYEVPPARLLNQILLIQIDHLIVHLMVHQMLHIIFHLPFYFTILLEVHMLLHL